MSMRSGESPWIFLSKLVRLEVVLTEICQPVMVDCLVAQENMFVSTTYNHNCTVHHLHNNSTLVVQ